MHHDRDSDLIVVVFVVVAVIDFSITTQATDGQVSRRRRMASESTHAHDYEHEKVWFRVNPRDISTSQLNASRRLHLWPITT